MIQMLATVGSVAEAEAAFAGGADVIDVLDSAGSVTLNVIHDVVAMIGKRCLVSATACTLSAPFDQVVSAVCDVAATGVDYVKVGITPDENVSARIAELAGLAVRTNLIGVFLAEHHDMSLLPLLGRHGFTGALIDTLAPGKRRLLDHLDILDLLRFVEGCHTAGLLAGLAGGLETPDIARLLVLAPDLLGFRDALRNDDAPATELDAARVRAVRGLIPRELPHAITQDVDYRLLAARTHTQATVEEVPVDLVFVDDLVLPVFIGAYVQERDAPQMVRFAVTASVMRTGRTAEDMRDVFSYDLITDGIRMLIGAGHISLVETLAERIATMVLGHPRVTKVVVRVQKLETGLGTVGVEIERLQRPVRAMDLPIAPPVVGAIKKRS